MRLVAERDRLHIGEALQDKASCAEQQQCQRDFNDHEPIAAAPRAFCFGAAERAGLQRGLNIFVCDLPCWPKAKENSR